MTKIFLSFFLHSSPFFFFLAALAGFFGRVDVDLLADTFISVAMNIRAPFKTNITHKYIEPKYIMKLRPLSSLWVNGCLSRHNFGDDDVDCRRQLMDNFNDILIDSSVGREPK